MAISSFLGKVKNLWRPNAAKKVINKPIDNLPPLSENGMNIKNEIKTEFCASTQDYMRKTSLKLFVFSEKSRLTSNNTLSACSFVFNTEPRLDILHKVYCWERACERRGTACVRNRGEMDFSKRKIRPQKGTGRARLSDRGAPHLHKGGKAHPPKPKSYAYFLPKRVVRLAYRMILSQRNEENSLFIIENISPYIKELKEYAYKNRFKRICIIDLNIPTELANPSIELQNADIFSIFKIKLQSLLKNQIIIITLPALNVIQRYLSFDGMRVTYSDEFYAEKVYNKKLEEYFSDIIRTPRRKTRPTILYKGARIVVRSRRYDLRRRYFSKYKKSRGFRVRE